MGGSTESAVFGPHDQAAGLRRWAEQQGLAQGERRGLASATPVQDPVPAAPLAVPPQPKPVAAEPCPLIVVGLTGGRIDHVHGALQRLSDRGYSWVGNVSRWRVYDLQEDSPRVRVLAKEKIRWALWVDDTRDSFQLAYATLRRLRDSGGPRTLLVLHPGISSHTGLLNNLQWSAIAYLNTELILLEEHAGGEQ